jgi:hypothetical protein
VCRISIDRHQTGRRRVISVLAHTTYQGQARTH